MPRESWKTWSNVLIVATLSLIALAPGRESVRADSPSTIRVGFLNETGQTANDLHVTFNVDMEASIIAWTGHGAAFPVSEAEGSTVHFNGADVPDQYGTDWTFTALVPAGGTLEIVSAVWTFDDVPIGPATVLVR